MNNLLLELKTIAGKAKQEYASFDSIRVRLKEVLHYFVLDCIYNSEFKDMIFYGGTCLRVVYNLPRMSEDLDFEWIRNDFKKLAATLESYFKKDIQVYTKTQINTENVICRITLSFLVLHELGLSPCKEETLRIKVEIRFVTADYLSSITPVHTLKTAYGKSFVLRHYDLPTLFAGKLSAILDRPKKGFTAGDLREGINFKGRDFYDLIWYMEKGVLPDKKILEANGYAMSIGNVFDTISVFIAQKDIKSGLKKDLEPLFANQQLVANFCETFRNEFVRLKQERYTPKMVRELKHVKFQTNFLDDLVLFEYTVADSLYDVKFLFRISVIFADIWDINVERYKGEVEKLNELKEYRRGTEERMPKYIALFKAKIEDYLSRNNREVYFSVWESKLIRKNDTRFIPEREIVFSNPAEIISSSVTLEMLGLENIPVHDEIHR